MLIRNLKILEKGYEIHTSKARVGSLHYEIFYRQGLGKHFITLTSSENIT